MTRKILSLAFWTTWTMGLVFLFAGDARAWGPGTHLECGRFLFQNAFLLAPAIRLLLRKYPSEFIYGSLCPDMVLGKKYMKHENNNHRWDVGFKILDKALGDRQKAFAYGYLSHLAADTVAHNIYIPDQLLDRFSHRRRGHVTFELVFDVLVDDDVWGLARGVSQKSFNDCERLMMSCIPRTPLPKPVFRRAFRGGAALVRTGGWEQVVRRLRPRLSREFDRADMVPYLDSMHLAAIDLLNNERSASCLLQCPTGTPVLAEAEDLRLSMKALHKRQEMELELHASLKDSFHRWRQESLFPNPSINTQ